MLMKSFQVKSPIKDRGLSHFDQLVFETAKPFRNQVDLERAKYIARPF